jgi:hypothetical protein
MYVTYEYPQNVVKYLALSGEQIFEEILGGYYERWRREGPFNLF